METAEKTIQSTEEVGAVSMSPSTSLLALLVECKEEIEYAEECEALGNALYAGCPRRSRLIQKLQAEIDKAKRKVEP